jgi:hypothetical protein
MLLILPPPAEFPTAGPAWLFPCDKWACVSAHNKSTPLSILQTATWGCTVSPVTAQQLPCVDLP